MNDSGRKPCRNCLFQEMEPADIQTKIREYTRNLEPDLRADDDRRQKRREACSRCDFRVQELCRACGCFIEIRIAVKNQLCPYEKW